MCQIDVKCVEITLFIKQILPGADLCGSVGAHDPFPFAKKILYFAEVLEI